MALDVQLTPQWWVRAGDQYIDLDVIRGHLMTTAVEYRPVPTWGIKLAGGDALSGTLQDRYAEFAVHRYGRDTWIGGVVIGRSGYDLSALGQSAVIHKLPQAYLAVSLPLSSGILTLGFDAVRVDTVLRETLRIGFAQPLPL